MQKALDLAALGEGYTNPNPMVGAVIVKDGRVIGTGYHHRCGGAHAEVDAVNNAYEDVAGSEMYVTLEPCSHQGRTPPCAKLLVERKIKKVYIAMLDPNPLVCGNGVRILSENGIEVQVGLMEEQAKKLNEIFIKYITTKMPFCILKTAMSLDGRMAAGSGDSKWISNQSSRRLVHRLRHRVSAIMIGVNSVIADNPFLTARIPNGISPMRIILDSVGRTPLDSNVLNGEAKTIIATTNKISPATKAALESNAECLVLPDKDGRPDLKRLMEVLGSRGIDSVLIEGGGKVRDSALEAGIVDKLITFVAPKLIGSAKYMSEAISVNDISTNNMDGDLLIEGYLTVPQTLLEMEVFDCEKNCGS